MVRVDKIESLNGILGLIITWVFAIVANIKEMQQLFQLREMQEIFQLIATTSAVIASLFTARYYWHKTKRLKNDKEA